ncbi:hypothetical protein [Ruegeria lacuscaerulensis]|uniref:hypothetical protein n=1 Tax=Ruegeria lacuscaerulensis TaxID=55218 RepID=UPI00147E8631|nr:hypothetical protein [Ruegeria lacuscaerulensis]
MNRYFAINMPFWRFARNTLIVSCAALIPLLLVFVLRTPGFATHLLNNGAASNRFLRQVITNGLPVVFAVNYLSFFLFAVGANARGRGPLPTFYVLIDLLLRTVLFIILHALIYALSADWFGSFGGDPVVALQVVGPTLVRSAYYENISGVYLYAALVGALPLYFEVIQSQITHGAGILAQVAGRLPAKAGPVILALILIAVSVATLTGVAALIVRLQSIWG